MPTGIYVRSKEHGKKVGAALRGRKLTVETKIKMGLARTGSKHWNWNGGKSKNAVGYGLVRAGKRIYKLAHRAVIEKMIGRELSKREIVHHWDEDKGNNQTKNLALLRHSTAHFRLHGFAKRHSIPVSALRFNQKWLINI